MVLPFRYAGSLIIAAAALLNCQPTKSDEAPDLGDCPDECIEESDGEESCDTDCKAEGQCGTLIDTVCEAVDSACDDLTFNECKNQVSQAFPCADVASVSDTFDECLGDLERMSECGEPFPLSCDGVLRREDGTAETCEEMEQRWDCLVPDAFPTCDDPNDPGARLTFPTCLCADGFIRNETGQCLETCEHMAEDWNCPANSQPACSSTTGNPECYCNTGYVARNGACVETCEHKRPSVNCDSFYPDSVATCEGLDVIANPVCGCADGWIGVFDDREDPSTFRCILDRCVDKEPYWYCADSAGAEVANCSCSCVGVTDPEDDPNCSCDMGYTYSAASDSCVPV